MTPVRITRFAFVALLVGVSLNCATARGQYAFHTGPSDWCSCINRTPEMFGDTFVGLPDISIDADGVLADFDVPFPGGTNRLVIANNNSPLPQDRIYTTYSHVNGALDFARVSNPTAQRTASLDQYVVGLEKAFWNDWASLEVRVPFAAQRRLGDNRTTLGNDSYLGDVSLIGKFVLSKTRTSALSAGAAIQLPTGDNIGGQDDTTALTYDNDGIYISPFLSFLTMPDHDWFWQGFLQVDYAAQGDGFTLPLQMPGQIANTRPSGEFNDQTLLRANLGVGRWFFRKPHANFFRAMAGSLEVHYTTTLEDTDQVAAGDLPIAVLSNSENYQDVLNLAGGLHVEMTDSVDVRVGFNVPLRHGSSRFHDASVLAQVNLNW